MNASHEAEPGDVIVVGSNTVGGKYLGGGRQLGEIMEDLGETGHEPDHVLWGAETPHAAQNVVSRSRCAGGVCLPQPLQAILRDLVRVGRAGFA
jgi:hypothetical protein